MTVFATPREVGLAIRRRRKELRWDQARLAQAVGASRQWIVDIEQGKPRAELELVLRAFTALGLALTAQVRDAAPAVATIARAAAPQVPGSAVDIDAVVERASRPPAWLKDSTPR